MEKKSNFYVYIHVKSHNGEIFYVGKGKGRRAYSKRDRNTFWKNIVNKYGYDIFILENNLTEDEAFELEEKYIKRIGRRDLNTGTLVNMTDGGEGASGISEEARQKISAANKGNEYALGYKHTDETKKKISKTLMGKKLSEEWKNKISESLKGRKFSEESKKKMSESAKGRKFSEETKKKMAETKKKYWADRKAKVAE